jgi:hypothetical protein
LIAWDSAASDIAWDTSCWWLNIVAENPVELAFAVWYVMVRAQLCLLLFAWAFLLLVRVLLLAGVPELVQVRVRELELEFRLEL